MDVSISLLDVVVLPHEACCIFAYCNCMSNAMHGHNINSPVCVCLSVTVSVNSPRLQVRPFTDVNEAIHYKAEAEA